MLGDLRAAIRRASSRTPVCRHRDQGTLPHGTFQEQFLDGHSALQRLVEALVGDAESTLAQHSDDDELPTVQSGPVGQSGIWNRRQPATSRAGLQTGIVVTAARWAGGGTHDRGIWNDRYEQGSEEWQGRCNVADWTGSVPRSTSCIRSCPSVA